MPDQTGYTLPAIAVRELHETKVLVLGSTRSNSKKFRRRRVAGGGGTEPAIVKLLNDLPGGTGDPRVPGEVVADDYEVVEGAVGDDSTIKNYSTKAIPSGTYLGVILIEGSWYVWPAFC